MIYSMGLMSNFEYLLVKYISETGGIERFFNNAKFGGVLERYFSCISYLTKLTHLSFLQLFFSKVFCIRFSLFSSYLFIQYRCRLTFEIFLVSS